MKYLFKEVNLNKKKEKIIDIYEKLVQEKNYRCKDILFIVPNNITKLNYIRSLDLKCSEEVKITTFSHFVQNEVIKYWTLICEDCSLIKDRKIMSTDGVLVVILNIDLKNKKMLIEPNITTRGFVVVNENQDLIKKIQDKTSIITLNELEKDYFSLTDLKNRIILEINSYVIELTGRRPIIIPMILISNEK